MVNENMNNNGQKGNYSNGSIQVIKSTERDSVIVDETDKVIYLIREYVVNRSCYIKGIKPELQCNIQTVNDDGTFVFNMAAQYAVPAQFSLYVFFKKFIEVECTLVEQSDLSIKATAVKAKIASKSRESKRLEVTAHDVHGYKFFISKNKVDLNSLTFSVSNRVIFSDAERTLSTKFPSLKILDMDPANNSIEKKLIKKFKQGFLLPDVQTKGSFGALTEGMLNLSDLNDMDVDDAIKNLRNSSIKSWMVRPFYYTNIMGEKFPIGYFVVKSTEKSYNLEDYESLEEEGDKIIERIKDANTLMLEQKEKVINISEGGVLIEINDDIFKEYITERTHLTFDLLFKYQAGLRFLAKIIFIHKREGGSFLVGLSFHGVVYSGIQGPGSKKILRDTLKYLVQQGAPQI